MAVSGCQCWCKGACRKLHNFCSELTLRLFDIILTVSFIATIQCFLTELLILTVSFKPQKNKKRKGEGNGKGNYKKKKVEEENGKQNMKGNVRERKNEGKKQGKAEAKGNGQEN